MAFDELWEQTHQTKLWGQYPNEQFTFFMRRLGPDTREERKNFQVLDVGCGQGANTVFLSREGYAVTALDAAPSALFRLYNRLKDDGLGGQLVRADLTQPLEFPGDGFDVVVDVHSSCYGTTEEVCKTIKELHRVLKPGGVLFCMMPKAGCANEHFSGKGVCTFASHEQIREWFSVFYGYSLMATICVDYHNNEELKPFLETWTIEARKSV